MTYAPTVPDNGASPPQENRVWAPSGIHSITVPEDVEERGLVAGRDSRNILVWIAVAFAVLEVASVVLIGVPAALALPFAGLFLVGAYWIRRGGSGGVVLVGALSMIEAIGVPFYVRLTTLDVLLQAMALVLGLAGVAIAVVAIRGRRVASAG